MTKAEKFIQDYTNHCSNELDGGGYHEWLTPEQARRAVEIAKEEFLKKVVELFEDNVSLYKGISGYYVAKELKQAMKDE